MSCVLCPAARSAPAGSVRSAPGKVTADSSANDGAGRCGGRWRNTLGVARAVGEEKRIQLFRGELLRKLSGGFDLRQTQTLRGTSHRQVLVGVGMVPAKQ